MKYIYHNNKVYPINEATEIKEGVLYIGEKRILLDDKSVVREVLTDFENFEI